jgi:hypothetical protein
VILIVFALFVWLATAVQLLVHPTLLGKIVGAFCESGMNGILCSYAVGAAAVVGVPTLIAFFAALVLAWLITRSGRKV